MGGQMLRDEVMAPPTPLAAQDEPKLRARAGTIHYWLERAQRAFLAVDGVDLDIKDGEFIAIVGPSGCGKSTFLNAIVGAQTISGGTLSIDSRPITGPGAERAMVFQ